MAPNRADPTHVLGQEDELRVVPTIQHSQALPVIPEQPPWASPLAVRATARAMGCLRDSSGREGRALGEVAHVTVPSQVEASKPR